MMSTTSNVSAGKRIEALLDDNSFVEIGNLVKARNTDFNLAQRETPADGVITGYGTINNALVYVYSQDATVLGGSVGEMHAKKIAKIYDMAIKMGAPVIGLVDCAGLRLEEATDALNAFGEIYLKKATASGVVPQVTAVFGNCGGGLSVLSQLSDFTFMADDAKLFVNSPNTIDSNYTEKCDTASSEFQSNNTANVDYVSNEDDVIAKIRDLVDLLPGNFEESAYDDECTDDLNRACAGIEGLVNDMPALIENVADNGNFFQLKTNYATDMVTGFIKLNGNTVGVVANNSDILSASGCYKAEELVKFCDAFDIPVLTLTNVKGFDTSIENEKRIARSAAKLAAGFASASVPKVNVITGDAIGNAANIMNAKALGADITISWTGAKVGIMDGKLASQITGADASAIDAGMNGAADAARRGYVDQVIAAADTRKYVIASFEMLYSKRGGDIYKKHTSI